MKIGSVFSGVGGIELGLELAGLGEVVWQVEIDPWCRGVLAMHWPKAKRFVDVAKVGRRELSNVDVICGGFPCQDISTAGTRKGIEEGERSGLWREFARIVRELSPRFVVVENVARLASAGLDVVVRDLDVAGYRVEGRIIAAEDVGAPHRRERLFIVAELAHDDNGRDAPRVVADRCDSHVADADSERVRVKQQRVSRGRSRRVRDEGEGVALDTRAPRRGRSKSRLGRSVDGLSDRVDRWPARPGELPAVWEPRRSTLKRSPSRAPRLHSLGNAVVPQVARLAGLRIRELLRGEQ